MLIGAEVQCNFVVRWAGIFFSDYYNIDITFNSGVATAVRKRFSTP
jgi:hypothetical protein